MLLQNFHEFCRIVLWMRCASNKTTFGVKFYFSKFALLSFDTLSSNQLHYIERSFSMKNLPQNNSTIHEVYYLWYWSLALEVDDQNLGANLLITCYWIIVFGILKNFLFVNVYKYWCFSHVCVCVCEDSHTSKVKKFNEIIDQLSKFYII